MKLDLEQAASFAAALRRADVVSAAAVYAEDAWLLPPAAEPLFGRDSIERFWQAGIDAGVSDVSFEAIDIRTHDGRAYEIGRYVLYVHNDTGVLADRGHYLRVHRLDGDGRWCYAVEMLSPDSQVPDPTHERAEP